jgi:2-polyprenyl-3-methyl-5-hydroxy-6-metoxy-1,4-benzoquinol methylase
MSEGRRVFSAYDDIRTRILNLDGSKFAFILFDRRKESIQSTLLLYINVSRVANYLTYIDFLDACNISLDGRKCLDLGTAFGVFPHLISQVYKDSEVYGIDVDETYISISRALFPDGNYSSGKLEELSESTKYDTIFCTQTIEHMTFPVRSIQILLSLVSSGGHLILTVPDGRSDLSPSAALRAGCQSYIGHVNFWSIESWASFLSENFEFRHAEVAITDRRTLYACIHVN